MARRLLLLALLLSVTSVASWAQAPVGGEFQVNSYTTNEQYRMGGSHPAVSSDANGNFVTVWLSYNQDGSNWGVFGQRFNAAGLRQGSEFPVNSYTTSSQYGPAVASDANGNFVTVWQSYGQDGSGWGVFGQRFDAAGLRQGSEFQVNSYTTGYQDRPAVAADANGNFVVVWRQDEILGGVFGKRFNAAGVPQGSEFQVNSYTTGYQDRPAVAADANGTFVVVWEGCCQCCQYGHWDIWGQRYGSDLIFKDGFE